jgi:hypothetical protein
MGSVHARGDTFLTFGLKALTETNTSRLATGTHTPPLYNSYNIIYHLIMWGMSRSYTPCHCVKKCVEMLCRCLNSTPCHGCNQFAFHCVIMLIISVTQYAHVLGSLNLMQSLLIWFYLNLKTEGLLIFKNTFLTLKITQHLSVTKISWLMLFREITLFFSWLITNT